MTGFLWDAVPVDNTDVEDLGRDRLKGSGRIVRRVKAFWILGYIFPK